MVFTIILVRVNSNHNLREGFLVRESFNEQLRVFLRGATFVMQQLANWRNWH